MLLWLALASVSAEALRDVPVGECYDCEVTCFEDCALKYDREILQMDFIQVAAEPEQKNRTTELTDQYSECLKEDKCPCPAAEAAATAVTSGKSKALELMSENKKKK